MIWKRKQADKKVKKVRQNYTTLHNLCKICNFMQKNRRFNMIILSLYYWEWQTMYTCFLKALLGSRGNLSRQEF